MTANHSAKFFDPKVLASIQPFGLRSRSMIEGIMTGIHHSPIRGQSIEFAEHRDYVAGDDLRQVDWKAFARSDRIYVRQYEDDTNLSCAILLDHSASMSFRGENSHLSKFETAQLLGVAIGYLLLMQQDRFSFATFNDRIDHFLPPSSSRKQINDTIQLLESTNCEGTSDYQRVVEDLAARLKKRHLIIVLSDFLGLKADALQALSNLCRAGNEVIMLQVLDHDEIHFPFDRSTKFEGLEGLDSLTIDPKWIAARYRERLAEWTAEINRSIAQAGGDYLRLDTSLSLSLTLREFLTKRQRRSRAI